MSTPRRYWDSSVFLAWLLPEPERKADCRAVLRAAEKGDVEIVTSAVTLTEVVKLKGRLTLSRQAQDKIERFFMHKYIIVREVDRFIGEMARRLIWDHEWLQPKDSIHVATALRWKIPTLDTFDDTDLVPLDGKLGHPPLRIGHPHMVEELELFPESQATSEEPEEE